MSKLSLSLIIVCLGVLPLTSTAAPNAPTQASAPSKVSASSLAINEKGAEALRAKDIVRAEELFARALTLDPGNTTAAYNLAGSYLVNKKIDQAVILLTEYTSKAPKDALLQVRLGDAYFAQKKLVEAEKAYQQALRIDSKVPEAASRLASIYTLNQRFKDAETMLLQAVTHDPKNLTLISNLSNVFLVNGKPAESISAAKRALQIRPSSQLYITMGNAYEAMKDPKNALISFKRASDLGDTSKVLHTKIDELEDEVEG